jgi:type I restriction enzyme S subunit
MLVRRLDDPGAKAGLNLPTVRGFPIALPPRHEQDEIVARLDSVDAAIASEERYVRKLLLMKAGLQEDLMSARVTLGAAADGAPS